MIIQIYGEHHLGSIVRESFPLNEVEPFWIAKRMTETDTIAQTHLEYIFIHNGVY